MPTIRWRIRACPPSEHFPHGVPEEWVTIVYPEAEFRHLASLRRQLDDRWITPERRSEILAEFDIIHEFKAILGAKIVTEAEVEEPEQTPLFMEESALPELNRAQQAWARKKGLRTDEFDKQAADERAAEGMRRASSADRVQAWKADADAWLGEVPSGAELTADDLVRDVGLPDDPAERERANNVVGAWFAAKSRAGLIEWSGRHAKSERVVGHGNLQRVWIRKGHETIAASQAS